jgi:hypothetical protein
MDKTTLLYTAGSNGEFTFRFLNQFKINPNISYTAWDEPPKFTEKYRGDHHLIREEDVDGHVTKITYNDENIDLINRNKWTKVKGHLEEQSKKTYPNNKNNEIYTMAIYKCLLLDKNNHFKKIYKENNIEIKFSWFFQSFKDWMKNFSNVFEKLNIPTKEEIILEYYNAFNVGQKEILDKHNRSNDLIFLSNKLGQNYFEKYQTNFSEQKFDEIYNNIGAQYV